MQKPRSISDSTDLASAAQSFFDERRLEEIADWIRVGLEHYVRSAGSFSGFAPVERYFNVDLPASEGLAAIDAHIDAGARSKLRNGLALAFDFLPISTEAAPIIKEVLYCARRVVAPEIFSYLVGKVKGMNESKGPFYEVASQEIGGRTLFDAAFQVVVDMPVESSLPALKELVGSRHFHVSQSGLALDALCRVDPRHFPEHFDQMREMLHEMFVAYNAPPRIRRLLAKRVITSIGLELFRTEHARLRFEASSSRPNDNWFYTFLFEGKDSLLSIKEGKIGWADHKPATWHVLTASSIARDLVRAPHMTQRQFHEPSEHDDPVEILNVWNSRLGGLKMGAFF